MITLFQSRDIKDYKEILNGLTDEFELDYWPAILIWCGILDNEDDAAYWQVYLVMDDYTTKTIGMIGLYSLKDGSSSELWLGWFGILPEYRSKGFGSVVLSHVKEIALSVGCKRLMSYVSAHGKPLNFYIRNGFQLLGKSKDYRAKHPELIDAELGESNDYIIEYKMK